MKPAVFFQVLLGIILNHVPFSLTAPIDQLQQRDSIDQITDTLLFSDTIDQFEAARNAQNPPNLDWSSDNCSDSPDNPLGFNFVPSCQRHDFGYRNYKAQNRFAAGKDRIDTNFKNDLSNQCNTYGNAFERDSCKGVADVYYEAVHEFGSKMKRVVEAVEER